jgi:hypothetical protein
MIKFHLSDQQGKRKIYLEISYTSKKQNIVELELGAPKLLTVILFYFDYIGL